MSSSRHNFDEENFYKIVFNLTNSETGNKVALASISSIQITQFYYSPELLTSDRYHLATINNRYNQNIKNANDVTITASGTVSWIVQADDTVFLNAGNENKEEELHVAITKWVYGADSKSNSHMFFMYIRHIPYINEM